MTNLFERKNIKPMLIGLSGEAFDSPDYIYELKLDGERCIAYLDPKAGTELRNKRNMNMLSKVPELSEIHLQVSVRCILDGELLVLVDGKPDFSQIQRRSLMTNNFKLKLQGTQHPASFVAFDILYHDGKDVTGLPLMSRKQLLKNTITENDRLAISRYIERRGADFFNLAAKQRLEGIVAKRKDSVYVFDKRTKDWIKIKNLKDDDFIVCGYAEKEKGFVSVVLGQYRSHALIYKGHVSIGISNDDFRLMQQVPKMDESPFELTPSGLENTAWLEPMLVCKVKYMTKMKTGYMRQPVFKGIRADKRPEECTEQAETVDARPPGR